MSIVNVVVEQHRALIGTNTSAGYMDSPLLGEEERRGRQSFKVYLHPQISMAMTATGDALLAAQVQFSLQIGCLRDFDEAAGMMHGFIDDAYKAATAQRKAIHGIDQFPGAAIVLVGWSHSASSFQAFRWERRPEQPAFIATGIEQMLLMPEIDRIEPEAVPDTDAKMISVMRRQKAYVDREHPQLSVSCGGRILMTEMTRDAVKVRTIANLEA